MMATITMVAIVDDRGKRVKVIPEEPWGNQALEDVWHEIMRTVSQRLELPLTWTRDGGRAVYRFSIPRDVGVESAYERILRSVHEEIDVAKYAFIVAQNLK